LRFETSGGAFDYTAGLYWQTADIDYEEIDPFAASLNADQLIPSSLHSLLPPEDVPNVSRQFFFDQQADTHAAFGETRWHMRDDLLLTMGLRYTYEKKKATQRMLYHEMGNPATHRH
jgi:iron complex outermembrane recepter protein